MSDSEETKKQAEAAKQAAEALDRQKESTKQLTAEEKKRRDEIEKFLESQEKANKISIRKLELDLDAAKAAGDINEQRRIANAMLKQLHEAQQASYTTSLRIAKIQKELNALKKEANETDEEFAKRRKELEKAEKQAQKELESTAKQMEDLAKATEKATATLVEVGQIADSTQELVDEFTVGLEGLTLGMIKANAGANHMVYGIAQSMKSFADSTDKAQILTESFMKVFRLDNIAAAVFDTVTSATKRMAMQFDQAGATFSKVTGLAGEYDAVLGKAQKQGNRFGISAGEAGESMSSLLAGFNDFHRSSADVQKDLALGVAGLQKFGVSTQESAQLLNNLNKIMGMSGKQALDTTKKIGMMGTAIGISTSKMLKDYNDSLKTLAVYGDKSIEVFTGIAAAAKAAGVETGTLLSLAEKFDTFSGAAETTGKLNAILGSQLSATEMLTMAENDRIKTLISTVQATGQSFGSMDKFTQKAVANAAGITDMAEANRIFGMSLSEYEGYEQQMASSADANKKFDEAMQSMIPVLDKFTILASELAVAFIPFLEALHSVAEGLISAFTAVDDEMGGLLGTVAGLGSGVVLAVIAMGGMITSLKTMYKLFIKDTFEMAKNIAGKLGLTQATNANTLAEETNEVVKKSNTATTGLQTAAENANTGAEKANELAKRTSTMTEKGLTAQKEISNAVTKRQTIEQGVNTTAKGTNAAATGAQTAAENANKTSRLRSMAIYLKQKAVIMTNTALKWLGVSSTTADTTAKTANTGATAANTAAQATANKVGGKAIPVMLALGAAILMIGAGIGIAALGMAAFVLAFSQLTGGQLVAATVGLLIFTAAFVIFMGLLIGLVAGPQAVLAAGAVGVLLAIGAAMMMIGVGVGIAAGGFALMLAAISLPSKEQYYAFGGSMLMFSTGIALAALGLLAFMPVFALFMAGLLFMAINPLAYLALGYLASVGASIMMIGVGAALAIGSLAALLSVIKDTEGLGDIMQGLFGGGKDISVNVGMQRRVEMVEKLIGDVQDADIKSELENIALITTGVSAGLMTENTVSNIVTVSALADTIQNIFNPEITIEMDKAGVEQLFRDGVFKVNRGTG